MLTIYHVPNTRGFRIIWLCEELGLDYRLERVDYSAEYRASPKWRRMNPLGKVPVAVDGDLTLFESGAIVQYLLARYGNGQLEPERNAPQYGLYLQWSWFAEATFSRATGEIANHKRAFAERLIPEVMDEMRTRARSCLSVLDAAVSDKNYLLGEPFSAADIMMGYCLQSFARHVGDPLPEHAAAYWARLTQRPAFVAADAANAMQ